MGRALSGLFVNGRITQGSRRWAALLSARRVPSQKRAIPN